MKNYKVTISDIADALNISSISVSRALANQSGVSEVLRNKILEKAKEMGYAKVKDNEINILVLNQKPYEKDNSNFSLMVQGIENALQNANVEYSLEFVSKEKQEQMYLPCKISKGNYYDGVIFIGKFSYRYASFIKEKINNQVFYLGYSPSYESDYVYYNFNNSAYKQCKYLIKNGHKNIGFIGGNDTYKNKEFLLGITTAMEDYELLFNPDFIINTREDLEEHVEELLNKATLPTAIICSLDFTAIKLLQILHKKNIRVPEDISVIGSGNTEMSTLSIPALTTMDLNISYSCNCVVDLLIKRINNPEKPQESIIINSNLIERNSVINIDRRNNEEEYNI